MHGWKEIVHFIYRNLVVSNQAKGIIYLKFFFGARGSGYMWECPVRPDLYLENDAVSEIKPGSLPDFHWQSIDSAY